MRALDAAEALRADTVDAAVLHVPTIKPLTVMLDVMSRAIPKSTIFRLPSSRTSRFPGLMSRWKMPLL